MSSGQPYFIRSSSAETEENKVKTNKQQDTLFSTEKYSCNNFKFYYFVRTLNGVQSIKIYNHYIVYPKLI